jgi:hypothetical protein
MIETMIEIIGMMIWNHIIMSLYVLKIYMMIMMHAMMKYS